MALKKMNVRIRTFSSIFAPAALALILWSGTAMAAYPKEESGGRPPMFTPQPTPTGTPPTPVPPPTAPPKPDQPVDPSLVPVTMFGMNLYLTGLERSESESATLGRLAAQGG